MEQTSAGIWFGLVEFLSRDWSSLAPENGRLTTNALEQQSGGLKRRWFTRRLAMTYRSIPRIGHCVLVCHRCQRGTDPLFLFFQLPPSRCREEMTYYSGLMHSEASTRGMSSTRRVHRRNEWDCQQYQQLNMNVRMPIAQHSMYGLHERTCYNHPTTGNNKTTRQDKWTCAHVIG
jgi:hypothetical protein